MTTDKIQSFSDRWIGPIGLGLTILSVVGILLMGWLYFRLDERYPTKEYAEITYVTKIDFALNSQADDQHHKDTNLHMSYDNKRHEFVTRPEWVAAAVSAEKEYIREREHTDKKFDQILSELGKMNDTIAELARNRN